VMDGVILNGVILNAKQKHTQCMTRVVSPLCLSLSLARMFGKLCNFLGGGKGRSFIV